jgi:subfamily B ATP-binding cassette protein MsbA
MRLRGIATQAQDKLAQSTIVLEETISCIQVVKSFVQEKLEIARFAKIMDEILALSKRRIVITAIFVPTMGFIALLTALMLLWYGGREVISQEMSPGDLIAFILYSVIIAHPMGIFAQLFTHLQEGIGASERIFEILDTRPDIQESPNAKTLPPIAGKIEVENLCFQYQKEREVLKNISFTIEAGQEIALVGPSGAGKSTLIRLLHRFYDPTSGTIKVDGIPLKDVSLSSYFKQVGIVPQETILFGDTIEMNIRYAKSDATQTEIINAAKSANAHDFIMESPMQYQTIVGEKGIRLSAGQRQRIAIARAILKNPRLLILDEATSSLDNESEKLIQDALERLLKNRTSFIIAHRLSTIQNADKIIVLDQGKIVEIGNHKELMEKKGLYHHLTTVRLMDTKQPTTDNTGI